MPRSINRCSQNEICVEGTALWDTCQAVEAEHVLVNSHDVLVGTTSPQEGAEIFPILESLKTKGTAFRLALPQKAHFQEIGTKLLLIK